MRATPRQARTSSSPSADADPATPPDAGRARKPILAVATTVLVAATALAIVAGLLAAGWPGEAAAQPSEGNPAQWRPQNDGVNGSTTLHDVAFWDASRGLAVGSSNVLATIDGGTTWVPQDGPGLGLHDVAYTGPSNAVAGGAGLWSSADGGATWTRRHVCQSGTDTPCDADESVGIGFVKAVSMVEAPGCGQERPRCRGWAVFNEGLVATSDGGKVWTPVESFPDSYGDSVNPPALMDVFFLDDQRGWVVARNGAILKTSNGGQSWQEQANTGGLTSHRLMLQAVHFADGQHGWAVGRAARTGRPSVGIILATDDGGETWERQPYPPPGSGAVERPSHGFNDVTFVDAQRGYVVGGFGDRPSLVYYTEDGGETWTRQHTGQFFELRDVTLVGAPGCPDEQPRCKGWAVGGGHHLRGLIIHTDDGRGDWAPQLPTLSQFYAASAADAAHVRVVGEIDPIAKRLALLTSDDGGRTWTRRSLDVGADDPQLFDISCPTSTDCLATGLAEQGGEPLVVDTRDGGETWTRQDVGAEVAEGISCSDPAHCHAVGGSGHILATDDGGETWQRQYACEDTTGSDCNAESSEDERITKVPRAVSFADGQEHGVVVGDDGMVVTTENGGGTWISRDAGVDDRLRDVDCDGDGRCLAVGGTYEFSRHTDRGRGGTGVVLASDDGGANWAVAKRSGNPDENSGGEVFTAVACDAGTCRVAGTGGTVLVTADGGDSWSFASVPTSGRPLNGLATAGERVWVASDMAQVYSTYHPPGAVDNLEVDAVDGSTAEVGWEAPSRDGRGIPAPPAVDYEVRVSSSPLTADNFGDATPCDDCSEFDPGEIGDQVAATVEGLEPGTQRFVGVRAVDEAGDPGPVRSARVELPDGVAPGRVDDLVATALSATSVELSWSAPASNGDSGPPVRRFDIGQAREPITADNFDDADHTDMLCPEGGCQLPAPDAVGDEFTLPVEDLTSDTDYHYAVRPVDGAGNTGAVSNSASVTTLVDGSAPARVQDLTASAVSPTEITLTWSAPDDGGGAPAGRFVIKQRQSGGFAGEDDFSDAFALCGGECVFEPASVGDRLELTVTDLTPGTVYGYALKAVDDAGDVGPRSNTAQATTPDGAGSSPAGADDAQRPSTGDDAPAGVEAAAEDVLRVSGADRIATAVAASREAFAGGQAQAAVVARADDFADGLAGVPLAAAENGPLLLTHSGRLDERVAGELDRVLADGARVFVLGGPAALADSVEARIADLGFEPVRLAGASRFETAAVIAEDGLGAPDEVLVATGGDFADAVTAGAAAARREAAVLLSAGDRLPPATADYRARHPASAEYAVGGPAARAVPQATPLVGAARFETAAVVADELFTDPATVGVATGLAFADALSGGAHIAAYGGPMLLSGPDRLHPAAADYLTAQAATIETAVVYGGPAALADAVANQTSAAITGGS